MDNKRYNQRERAKRKQQKLTRQSSEYPRQVENSNYNDAGLYNDQDNDDLYTGQDYCDTDSPPAVNEEAFREYFSFPEESTQRSRKDFWHERSSDVKEWYIQSFQLNGHPNPCLAVPDASNLGTHSCNCPNGKDLTVNCFMLHSHTPFTFKHCNEHPILKTLLLMQMLPCSTVSPKTAIHFAVFEKLQSLKLNGSISNYAFVKSENSDNFLLANYDIQKVWHLQGRINSKLTTNT